MSDTILVVDPSYRGPQGATGIATYPLAVSSMADLKALPKPLATNTPCMLGGWYTNGDGGGGMFIWDAASVATPNDGTIVQANAGGAGRWIRLLEYSKINVKWFGAKGDAVHDDTANIQAAINYSYSTIQNLGNNTDAIVKGYEIKTAYEVYMPKGKYLISATIELPANLSLVGEHDSLLYTADNTLPLLRIAGYYNNISSIGFGGGRFGIAVYGNSVNYGNIGDPNNPSIIHITNCTFRYQYGPSIYQDTSVIPDRSLAQIIVDGFDFQGSCFLFGTFRNAKFSHGYALMDHITRAVTDDSGRILSVWNCGDDLTIEDSHCEPLATIVGNNSSCWICGTTNLIARNTRFNNGDSAVIVRIRSLLNYNFMPLPVSSSGIPRVILDHCNVNSCFGIPWLEVYDALPSVIDVQMPISDQFGAPPREDSPMPSCVGVWINSTSVPKTSYVGLNGLSCYIDLHGLEKSNYVASRFMTSANLSDTVKEDVTGHLLTYKTQSASHDEVGPALHANVWLSGAIDWLDGNIAGTLTGVALALNSTTGYNLTQYISILAVDGASVQYKYIWGAGITEGLYTLSFLVQANYNGKMTFDLNDTEHLHDLSFYKSDEFQRVYVPFYHDGNQKTLTMTLDNIPAGLNVTIGHVQINKGPTPSAYIVPGNAMQLSRVHSEYWSNTVPVVGTYRTGDRVWNSAPTATGNTFWYCYAGGSPGSWVAAGGPLILFANDLSGTATSQNVLSATGVLGFFDIKCAFMTYVNSATNPELYQKRNTLASGYTLGIHAQSTSAVNQNGGILKLSGGQRDGTGIRGGVKIQMDEYADTLIELAQLTTRRFVSMCKMVDVTLVHMPDDTGDGVIYLGNATDTPKVNCTGGIIIYCDAGTLKTRGTAGTVTNLAPP